ncbi:voltage-dependent anion channel-domain-containing protein [Diplogelasinospora grovesii]|uniref:Voltage-dependent anion channel-domain-containing protein n=1 Tax=Diplogelasinospora grovesii TaxID=303347 RepID=A0AAN6S503_9PEZI|nr:voltage-dependent anion channel-domain-containing protein [Diplogelasinospora grovesii]
MALPTYNTPVFNLQLVDDHCDAQQPPQQERSHSTDNLHPESQRGRRSQLQDSHFEQNATQQDHDRTPRTSIEYPYHEKTESVRSFNSTTALNQTDHRSESRSRFSSDEEEQGRPTRGDIDPYSPSRPKLPLRPRLRHFTWAWYTLTMSTGGLSLLLFAQPHRFPGLVYIGLVFYVTNLLLFAGVTTAMLTRFFLFPGSFRASLTHPREGFFFPTFFLSIATIITSTQRYAISPTDTGPLWLIQMAFWVYVALTTLVAVGQYSYVFAAHSYGLQTMMPTWILPIFPIMLSGTIASVIASTQPADWAVSIVTAGLTCQGLGVCVAVMMYAHMVGRLMQSGLPDREHRPGLFMCVGPPAFTALAFIGMAQSLPANFDHDMDCLLDAGLIKTMAVVGAGFLWALSFWWFGIALLAVLQSPPKYFHLGWYAMVFPNTGFTLATISLGNAFKNQPVLWFATGMSILLVLTYAFVLYYHVRAILVQDIMYPGRDEDVEDH